MHSIRTTLLAVTLCIPFHAVKAAEEFQDSIPIEVAEALFGFGIGGELQVYADIVEEFPPFELPGQFGVIGSTMRSPSLTVALETSLSEDAARAAITEAFLREDWVELPSYRPPVQDYGFVSVNQPRRPTYEQLCHDEYGQMNVSFRERGTQNIVSLSTGAGFGGDFRTCAERIAQQQRGLAMQSQRGMGVYEYMPLLEVPEEARQGRMPFVRRGGTSSSGNSAETYTTFSLEWDLEDVYADFAEQMIAQDWALDAESLGSVTASGTWTQQIESGVNIVARLDILNSEEDRFNVTLRVEGPGGRGSGSLIIGN